jgi:uncharacterized membrane protein YczE
MKKIGRMNEIAWIIGIVGCALGVSLCTKANFGLSMIAAPPYIFHVAFRVRKPWLTQGTAEYIWQGILLLFMCIVTGRFHWKYLLSFGTAVISGLCIDFWLLLLGGNGAYESLCLRIPSFILGAVITSLSISFAFRTTWPIAIYELLVREIADKFSLDLNKVKLMNDIIMLILSAVLAFVLTGGFNGFGPGTILITFINAPLIAFFGKFIDRKFTFESRFPKLTKIL